MKMCKWNCFKKSKREVLIASGLVIVLLSAAIVMNAQDGKAGIDKANGMVRDYYSSGTKLMYACGAIVGLIGAVKVYQKWSSGDPDTGRVAAAWFGACVFLVLVATVITSFFAVG